jgi:hypothetical protein
MPDTPTRPKYKRTRERLRFVGGLGKLSKDASELAQSSPDRGVKQRVLKVAQSAEAQRDLLEQDWERADAALTPRPRRRRSHSDTPPRK